ncbi:MAG: hypothetical protein BBJ60_07125 [Desulfobacterales bacterium S7086C20]|nr:MAG: hypothetical protein BBJ60_07125 [Desulfobacterales bacterium S7086C20]
MKIRGIQLISLAFLLSIVFAQNASIAAPVFLESPSITANPNPAAPLAAVLKFAANQPVQTTISVFDGDNSWQLKYGEDSDPTAGLPIIGMRPDREHNIRIYIRTRDGDAVEAPEMLKFMSPPLPSDPMEFPPIKVNVSLPEQMEPGITLMSVRRMGLRPQGRSEGAPGGREGGRTRPVGENKLSTEYGLLMALDSNGNVVWYYRTDTRISDFAVLRNGNLAYLTADHRALVIDWFGNIVDQYYAAKRPQGAGDGMPLETLTFHHGIEELPSGNLLLLGTELREIDGYYTSETDPAAPRARQKVMGDVIIEFSRNGNEVWRWNVFDHLDINRLGYGTFNFYWQVRGFPDSRDWTHGNGLWHDDGDDSLLLNLRIQSAVVKIERPSGKIRWIFAEPGGWAEKYQPLLFKKKGEIEWPWYQHAPSITSEGNLLLFDNGIMRARPFKEQAPISEVYSRAVQYSIDEEGLIAQEVWSSDVAGPKSLVSFAMGDADYLPSKGNVLITYATGSLQVEGSRVREPHATVREVTASTPAKTVYEVELADPEAPVIWAIFGSKRIRPAEGLYNN